MEQPIVDFEGFKITPSVVSVTTVKGERTWPVAGIQQIAIKKKFDKLALVTFLIGGFVVLSAAESIFGLTMVPYWFWVLAVVIGLLHGWLFEVRYRLQKLEISSGGRRTEMWASRREGSLNFVRNALERAIQQNATAHSRET